MVEKGTDEGIMIIVNIFSICPAFSAYVLDFQHMSRIFSICPSFSAYVPHFHFSAYVPHSQHMFRIFSICPAFSTYVPHFHRKDITLRKEIII